MVLSRFTLTGCTACFIREAACVIREAACVIREAAVCVAADAGIITTCVVTAAVLLAWVGVTFVDVCGAIKVRAVTSRVFDSAT